MGRKANPALLGAFVVGAVALAVAGLVVFGGGRFFRPRQVWRANFDESVKGLNAGSAVTFRGVRVGSVREVRVLIDPRVGRLQTPVIFTVDARRLATADGQPLNFDADPTLAQRLFEEGLRAQLDIQSYVTGQLSINLDFHPGAPLTLAPGAHAGYPEMPTIPSKAAALGRSLEDLNLPEIVQEVRNTIKAFERVVASPDVEKFLTSAASTFEGTGTLVAATNRRLASLGPSLEKVSQNLDETLGEVRALARGLDQRAVPAATETLQDIREMVRRVNAETLPAAGLLLGDLDRLARRADAETLPAANQLLAEVRQLAANFEKTAEAGRLALEQVQKLAANADGAIDEESPLRYQLDVTLREVTAAARAFRVLTSYLEQHPDSIIFGKSGK
jgi:paraquat-inducible protein B